MRAMITVIISSGEVWRVWKGGWRERERERDRRKEQSLGTSLG